MKIIIADHEYMILWDGVYNFPLSDYPRITPFELKKIFAFVDYEKKHGRKTEIECDDEGVMLAIDRAKKNPDTYVNAALPEKITECTMCPQRGCVTKYVCHTTEPENAKKILSGGKLLSAARASKKSTDELKNEKRNAANDPADYFGYIMFNWGNCQGGYRLAAERMLGRFPSEDDLEKNFRPGVRFFFLYAEIERHPGFVFDGHLPAKIRDELLLKDYLTACVIPEALKKDFDGIAIPELKEKIFYLPQDGLGLWDWTNKVYEFAESLAFPIIRM